MDIKNEALWAVDSVIQKYEGELKKLKRLGKGKGDLAKDLKSRIKQLRARDRKKRVLELARIGKNGLGLNGDEWDRDPWSLQCVNGVINLKDGSLSPGRPDQYFKTVCPTPYDPNIPPSEVFINCLNQIQDGNQENVEYLLQLLGSSLIGEVRDRVLPIFYGPHGFNGKGTLLKVLTRGLGIFAGTVSSELLLDQQFNKPAGSATPEIMHLRGKRLVWAAETSQGRRFSPGVVKRLIGGEQFVGRDLYGKHEVEFMPSHTLILMTNHKPHAPADDDSFFDKVHLLVFPVSFVDRPNPSLGYQEEADPDMDKVLLSEKQGILRAFVLGCIEYQKVGYLKPPQSVLDQTSQYRQEENVIGKYIDDCIVRVEGGKLRAIAAYEDYKKWCSQTEHEAVTETEFGTSLGKRFKRDRDGKGKYYKGAGLKTDRETAGLQLVKNKPVYG
jgi:putative DNA primase/helicase